MERKIQRIFIALGMQAKTNQRLGGYEVDVLASNDQTQIIIECKQYESSYLNVKNLIHEWNGKQQEIGADKVVIATTGVEITEEMRGMAAERGMVLWNEEEISYFSDLMVESKDKLEEAVISNLDLQSSSTEISQDSKLVEIVEEFKQKTVYGDISSIYIVDKNEFSDRYYEDTGLLREPFGRNYVELDYNDYPDYDEITDGYQINFLCQSHQEMKKYAQNKPDRDFESEKKLFIDQDEAEDLLQSMGFRNVEGDESSIRTFRNSGVSLTVYTKENKDLAARVIERVFKDLLGKKKFKPKVYYNYSPEDSGNELKLDSEAFEDQSGRKGWDLVN